MKAPASKTAKARSTPAKAPARLATKPAARPVVKVAAKAAVKPPAKAAVKTAAAKTAPVATKPVPAKKTAPATKVAKVAPVAASAPPKVPASPAKVRPAAASAKTATSQGGAGRSKMRAKAQPVPAIEVPAASNTLAPDAPKATFTHINERVKSLPVTMTIQKDPKRANNWKSLSVDQLTDQDVLAMPDSEYMNDVQLAFFKLKLQQLRADMLANAGETTEHLREDTVVVPDPADRATIEEEHALELRTRDRERKLLKKIEQAIARIDSGDYGYCEETGEPIGVGRLMARPTASLSLEAQQRRELKQKMFGD